MNFILPEAQEKWAPVVGKFIIEFGHCESAVTEIIRLSVMVGHFKILRSLNFSKKMGLAKATLLDWNPSQTNEINNSFQQLNAIAQRRNIVAHNGLSIAIYEAADAEGNFYEIGMSQSYKATDIWLQIEDIDNDTIKLKSINEKLIDWVRKDKVSNISLV